SSSVFVPMSMIARVTAASYRQPVRRGGRHTVVRAALAAGLVMSGAAHADDAASVHEEDTPALMRKDDEALLHLDPIATPTFAGLGATAEVAERTSIALGRRSWVELQGTKWATDLDVPAHGSTVGVRLAHDFGWFVLSANAALSHIDMSGTMTGRGGTYRDLSLTISKSKRFSRWVTG